MLLLEVRFYTNRITEHVHYLGLKGFLELHELAVIATLYLIVKEGGIIVLVSMQLCKLKKPTDIRNEAEREFDSVSSPSPSLILVPSPNSPNPSP